MYLQRSMSHFIRNLRSVVRTCIIFQQVSKIFHVCATRCSATWPLTIQCLLMENFKSDSGRQSPPFGTFSVCHSHLSQLSFRIGKRSRTSPSSHSEYQSLGESYTKFAPCLKKVVIKMWSSFAYFITICFSLILPSLKRVDIRILVSSCKSLVLGIMNFMTFNVGLLVTIEYIAFKNQVPVFLRSVKMSVSDSKYCWNCNYIYTQLWKDAHSYKV
jgi:hypothetical protein